MAKHRVKLHDGVTTLSDRDITYMVDKALNAIGHGFYVVIYKQAQRRGRHSWWILNGSNSKTLSTSETYSSYRKCLKTAAKVAVALNCNLYVHDLRAEAWERAGKRRWRAGKGTLLIKHGVAVK
jgi:hypothetical protein